MKWLLFKIVFIYPRIYSFFHYYRKKEWRKEFEDKAALFYKQKDPQRIKKIVKGVSELRGVRKVMRYLIPHMDMQFLKRFVNVEGIHHLDQALNEKKGILLMAGHIGVPHLAFNALRVMGYDVILLSGVTPKRPKHPTYRYYDTDDHTIFVHDPSLAKTYKKRISDTLQSGGIIYYDADAGEGRASEEVAFLGAKMNFPTGMVYFAHQAEATIIPFIHLYKRGKISLIFKEPVNNHWRRGKAEYNTIITEFAKLLEYYILKYPEQYLGIYGPTVLSYYYRSHHKAHLQNVEETKEE